MKLDENSRKAAFAILALAAVGAAAYVLFLSPQPDVPSDGREFYYLLSGAGNAGLFYDVRGLTEDHAAIVYQCGVDIISKGRLAGKSLSTVACDGSGCLAAESASNGTSRMTFEQAQRKFENMPYILVRGGSYSSYSFFQRHMEITLAGNATGGCDISATES